MNQIDQKIEKIKNNYESLKQKLINLDLKQLDNKPDIKKELEYVLKKSDDLGFICFYVMHLQKETDAKAAEKVASELFSVTHSKQKLQHKAGIMAQELKDAQNQIFEKDTALKLAIDQVLFSNQPHHEAEQLNNVYLAALNQSSKLLWCLEFKDDPDDDDFKQVPAQNKDIARRALNRYREIHKNGFKHQSIIKSMNECIRLAIWQGSKQQHEKNMLFDAEWFNKPMFKAEKVEQLEYAFSHKDLVLCKHKGRELLTKDIEAAKHFFNS